MKINNQKFQKPDIEKIKILYKLIQTGDQVSADCVEMLILLGFIPSWRRWKLDRFRISLINCIDPFIDPILFVLVTISITIFSGINAGRLSVFMIAFLVAYIRWIKNQRSKNVEDAMLRKDKANSMIIDHADLLFPYTGNVFDFEAKYTEKSLDNVSWTKIKMYIFTEIDNLEFVFDKSRAGLIEDKYTLRAIKIFVARAENEGFYNLARRLIITGRYNERFTNAVKNLLYVGNYSSSILSY